MGEPAIDCRFDEIGREESKRDGHIDLSRAAIFPLRLRGQLWVLKPHALTQHQARVRLANFASARHRRIVGRSSVRKSMALIVRQAGQQLNAKYIKRKLR